jgi:hypothetical protein
VGATWGGAVHPQVGGCQCSASQTSLCSCWIFKCATRACDASACVARHLCWGPLQEVAPSSSHMRGVYESRTIPLRADVSDASVVSIADSAGMMVGSRWSW